MLFGPVDDLPGLACFPVGGRLKPRIDLPGNRYSSNPYGRGVWANTGWTQLPAEQARALHGEGKDIAKRVNTGHLIEDEIAEAVDDWFAVVYLTRLDDMRMRAYHEVRSGVNREPGHILLMAILLEHILDAPMGEDDEEVYLRARGGDILLHQSGVQPGMARGGIGRDEIIRLDLAIGEDTDGRVSDALDHRVMRLGAVGAATNGRDAVRGQPGQHIAKRGFAEVAAVIVRHGDDLEARRAETIISA